jgi:hypothetical protein
MHRYDRRASAKTLEAYLEDARDRYFSEVVNELVALAAKDRARTRFTKMGKPGAMVYRIEFEQPYGLLKLSVKDTGLDDKFVAFFAAANDANEKVVYRANDPRSIAGSIWSKGQAVAASA